MSNPACPIYGHNEHVIKSGLNHTKSQRYRCQQCRRYFTVAHKPHGYDLALRKQALKLYLEETSFRTIGRLLGVHHQSASQLDHRGGQRLAGPRDRCDTCRND